MSIATGFADAPELGITAKPSAKPLYFGLRPSHGAVDNANLLVDERSRAGLDAPHARDRQWQGQGDYLTYPQGA